MPCIATTRTLIKNLLITRLYAQRETSTHTCILYTRLVLDSKYSQPDQSISWPGENISLPGENVSLPGEKLFYLTTMRFLLVKREILKYADVFMR